MSTILKALRRLEQENARPLGGRPLREEVAGAQPAVRVRGSWRLVAGALAAGAALGIAGFLLWPEGSRAPLATSPAPEAPAAVAAPPAEPREPPARFVAGGDPLLGPPPEAFASSVEVVDRPQASPLLSDDEVRSPSPPRSGRYPPYIESKIARSAAPPATSAERVSGPAPEAPLPTSSPVGGARRAATAQTQPTASPPPASATPRAAPRVFVEKTVWHPDPERREAVVSVSGREGVVRVREGDTVGLLVVSEIQPTGVRFTHLGVPLERRVGGTE